MNHWQRQAKEYQLGILDYATTLDKPVRYSSEKPFKKMGGPLINVLNTGLKSGNLPQGLQVTNFGSYHDDPRRGGSKPISGPYMRRKASQLREQYEGPRLLTGAVSDSRSIPSIVTNEFKGDYWRQYAFRRGIKVYDVIALDDNRLGQNQPTSTRDKRDLIGTLDVERDPSRVRHKLNPGFLLDIGTTSHTVYDQGYSQKGGVNPGIIDSKQSFMNAQGVTQGDSMSTHSQIGHREREFQQAFDKAKRPPPIQRLDPASLIKSVDTAQCVINGMNKPNQFPSQVPSQTILMVSEAIKDYQKERIPLNKSRYLTTQQRTLIDEFVRSGLTQDELVNVLYNTNQTILNTPINRNDYVSQEVIAGLINQQANKHPVVFDRKLNLLNIYTVESQPILQFEAFKRNQTNKLYQNETAFAMHDIGFSDYQSDIGRARSVGFVEPRREHFDMTLGERPVPKKDTVRRFLAGQSERPDLVYNTLTNDVQNRDPSRRSMVNRQVRGRMH